MSKTVVLPNGLEVSFPDNATDAEMSRAIGKFMFESRKASSPTTTAQPAQPEATGKFFKSIPKGLDKVQMMAGAGLDAIGEATGLEGLEKYGEAVAKKGEADLAVKEALEPSLRLEDVKNVVRGQQSFVDYMQQSLGEVLPSMGLSVGSGFAGAKAGAAAGAKLGLTGTLAIPLPGARAIGVGVGSLIGGTIGAFLPSFLLGSGDTQSTIKELDPDARNPWAALGGGVIIGALDVASLAIPVLGSLGKGIPKETVLKGLIKGGVKESTARGALGTANKALTKAAKAVKGKVPKGRLGKGLVIGGLGAGSEALTERLQELTSIEIGEAVTDKEVMNRAERLLEATVMGAIAGGGFGGGAGIITGKNYNKDTPPPTVERGAYDEIILSIDDAGITPDIQDGDIATPVGAAIFEGQPVDPVIADILNPQPIELDTVDIRNQLETEELVGDIAEARARITRGDQQAIEKTVAKKPISWMKAIVTGDINYNNKINKSQSKKVFAERIGKTDVKDRRTVNTIFNTLVNKGQIEKVGPNRWKYTDKSLRNKDLKSISNADKQSIKISDEAIVNGNKAEWQIEVNDKNISVIKETKEVKRPVTAAPIPEPVKAPNKRIQKDVENIYEDLNLVAGTEGSYEGVYKNRPFRIMESKNPNGTFTSIVQTQDSNGNFNDLAGSEETYVIRDADDVVKKQLGKVVTSLTEDTRDAVADFREPEEEIEIQTRWTVRGPSKKGGIKNIRNDKEFSVQPLSDKQQLESIKEQVIGYVDNEFVGSRSKDKLVDMDFPVGLLLEEKFQVSSLNQGILNQSGKPYTSLQGMITDIKQYDKQIADIEDSIEVKQQELKNFKSEPETAKIIEREIQDLQIMKDTKEESIQQINHFLNGLQPATAIGRTPTVKELKQLMTPKQKLYEKAEKKILEENIFNSQLIDGTGAPISPSNRNQNIKAGMSDKGIKDSAREAIREELNRVNFYSNWLTSMQNIANDPKNKPFLPFHKLMRKYDEIFRGITNRTTIIASPYSALNKEQKANVDKILIAGMIAGVKANNGVITIPARYSFQGYGEVKDANDQIITKIEVKEENGKTRKETDEELEARIQARIEEAPDQYNEAYFQEALDLAVGGKSRNDLMFQFKVGKEYKLNNVVEQRALESMYLALDGLWLNYMEASINASGRVVIKVGEGDTLQSISDPNLFQTLKNKLDAVSKPLDQDGNPITTMSGLLEQMAIQEKANEKLAAHYSDIAASVKNMEQMQKDGYFPSVREGDGFIRIYKKAPVDIEGKPIKDENGQDIRGETYNRIDITIPQWKKWKNKGDFEKSAKDWMAKHYPNWKDDYQKKNESGLSEFDDSFEIEFIGKDAVDENSSFDQNYESIERMLLEQDRLINNTIDEDGLTNEETRKYEERLTNTFKAYNNSLRNKSFRSHTNRRKGIPGFITPINQDTYIAEAFGLYTVKAARLVARMNTEEGIRTELRELKKLKDATKKQPQLGNKSLYDIAVSNAEFVFSPQSPAALFKTIAFNGFLGGNISSLMVNLSQNMITGSFLFGAYGLKGRGSVLKAFKDSALMIKDIAITQGRFGEFIIPPLAEDGVTPTELNNRGEALYNKWKKYITREEYKVLAEQSARGTFGKMNTEAIANNSDVTSKFLETKIIGDTLPQGATNTISQGVGAVSRALTTMYASGEMVNRMTASLAAVRLVKKFGSDELRNFTDGIPGQDRLNETEYGSFDELVAAGNTVSNATQFNLDPFNRSRLSRQLGGVPIQFLGFVTMMIEVYTNTLKGRYGRKDLGFMNDVQKRRMVIGMVGQQLALGGLFALPFLDDLDDVVGILSEKLGMGKTSVYEVLYESLIDDAGVSSDTATALLRGPLEGYGPISIGKRIALSPFQNVLNMNFDNIFEVPFKLIGGPSASFIEGWGERVVDAAREGRWDKVALYFPPTAVTTNLANAFYNSTEGMQTGTGRQLNDGLNGMDILWGAVGFTSTTVSKDREQIRRNKYLNSRMRKIRDRYTDRITKATLQLQRETDPEKKEALRKYINEKYKEILEHDSGKEPEDKIDPSYSIATSVGSRLKQVYSNVPGAIAPVSKPLQYRALQLTRED